MSFSCGGNRYFSFDIFFFFYNFAFFLALSFFFLLKTSHGVVECLKFRYLLSGVLKYSVLAHAHVLQKLVMNVNNAKAIKIILDLIRSNAIPCQLGCFVGVRSVKHQKCQISRVPQALMLKLNWKRLTKIKLRL